MSQTNYPEKCGAAYVRVSDERQDEYSPDSQLKMVRKYAKEHGYLILDEYVFYDDGISAKTVKKRKAFNDMIALAKEKSHPIDAIFVWKFSRFARNQEESIVYKSLLKKNRVDVISVSEPIDNGPFGSLIERIIEWMDEYYLIRLSGEVRRGMTEKVNRGEPVCAPAFGYDLVDKKYIPNKDAPIVRQIFERYNAGEKVRTLAMSLAASGVRTRFGNPPDNRWVTYLLHNPVYIGKIRWCTNGAGASKRDWNNAYNIIADGKHEPIISQQLWDDVQKRLEDQKRSYPKYQRANDVPDWTFKGLLRCGSCGATLVRAYVSSKYPGVQCHNYNRGTCHDSHYMEIEKLTRNVLDGIEHCIAALTFPIQPQNDCPSGVLTADYDSLIAAENKRLNRLREAYLNGVETVEEYADHKNQIEKKIEALKEQKEKSETHQSFDPVSYAKKVQEILLQVKDPNVPESTKNELLRTVISKIVFHKAEQRFEIFFQAP